MASIARSMGLLSGLRPRFITPATLPPLRRSSRLAAFHTSSARKAILPVPPQRILGDINHPAPVPESKPLDGSYHWTFERLLAAGLVPLTVAPFAGASLHPVMDAILCTTLLLHSHIGFDACIVDYFPKRQVPRLHNFLVWFLRGSTLVVGWGLYEFETNDVGVAAAVAKIWKS